MGNSLNESVENYAKEGGSKSRARRPPLHSSQRARLENKGLTSDWEGVVSASGENCAFQFLWCKSGYVTIGLSISLL